MEENKTDGGNEVLLSYIGMNLSYTQGKLMHIDGKEDAVEGDIGTVDRPVQADGVTIPATESDPVLFSYLYAKGDESSLRQLLVKINSWTGDPARFTVLIPAAKGGWGIQTVDLTLVDSDGKTLVINPHGLAQYGNYLYLVDYQIQKIFIVDAGRLEAAADGTAVEVRTFDLSGDLTADSKGQAVIIIGGYLYALYIVSDTAATKFDPSVLFRLAIDGATGALSYDTQITVGRNAQSIIPVKGTIKNADTLYLLIPATGGRQWYGGITNGTNSNISYVEAEAETWPTAAPVKLTGDPAATPVTNYDIHAAAAALRDGDSALFILTQIYTGGSDDPFKSPTAASYRIYRTSVNEFLNLPDGIPIIKAVDMKVLTPVDERTLTSVNGYGMAYGIYFWDLLYEQVPDTTDDSGDRLWAGLGTPILVTSGAYETAIEDPAYGSPTGIFQNDYIEFGYLGGVNVNAGAFDLLIETANQAKRGVSLKRTFRKTQTPRPTEEEVAAAQAKAAQAKGK
ncbi:MAG: hypothetical protein LBP81_08020 [Treponema sp.]|jgi:hypothetical protein|nr:hypothetical protein [Treponema sp.]